MSEYTDVSCYLRHKADTMGIKVCNLKLQKLMYYSQGLSLAITNNPLFTEDITAWDHGPVVEPLYHECKSFGNSFLPPPSITACQISQFSDSQIEIMDEVVDSFGRVDAWSLRNNTHKELPWVKHSLPEDKGDQGVITKDEIMQYFKDKFDMTEYHDSFMASIPQKDEQVFGIPSTVDSADKFYDFIQALPAT